MDDLKAFMIVAMVAFVVMVGILAYEPAKLFPEKTARSIICSVGGPYTRCQVINGDWTKWKQARVMGLAQGETFAGGDVMVSTTSGRGK